MSWVAYALAWVAAAAVWALAAASSSRQSPLAAFRVGAPGMAVAGAMGVGVWHLTARLPWERRGARFYLLHSLCIALYAAGYTAAFYLPDLVRGRFAEARAAFAVSPVVGWTLMMGAWLYLIIAGISYAVRAQQRLRRAEALLLDAQLAALRARLNPHFLFNALHAVSALLPDPAAADEALDRLGALLRYALDEHKGRVPLASEWRFTSDYLEFERLRLGDRLTTRLDVRPEALDVEVPALVLQPLVENAVLHGIAPNPKGGTVQVTAGLKNGSLELSVADDGPGAESASADGPGIGLQSLRQRLDALYGDRASVRIETAPGAGYRVTLTLPARP